jgi:autoinducer 2 (AI-2) kinase
MPQNGFFIVDIGTGNVRVAVTSEDGKYLHIERDNVHYVKDELYPDALYFDPNALWDQIVVVAAKAIKRSPDISIRAITASSQREGVVLIDAEGKSLIGLSNHDHRGREWENIVEDKHYVYSLTGRYPGSLFSAMKLVGIRHRRPEIYRRLSRMLSISDWAQFMLSGVAGYEHSQASETLLYDVAAKRWSPELCDIFDLQQSILPPLKQSGSILGNILPEQAKEMGVAGDVPVVVGGADTQLAIKSTQPSVDDIVIVSGTTTPIVKIVKDYIVDGKERTWTNRHIDADNFILEANAGVTGLNYQRLKEIFYPNEGYDVIEKELAQHPQSLCVASLGSLVAEEKSPLVKGGFIFDAPVSHELSRASFVRATLWDIACCIKENFECLCAVSGHTPEFAWGCGGGFQSAMLRQLVADLTGKRILFRQGFEQSSVMGGALICSEALGLTGNTKAGVEEVHPKKNINYSEKYREWKDVRANFKQTVLEEVI